MCNSIIEKKGAKVMHNRSEYYLNIQACIISLVFY